MPFRIPTIIDELEDEDAAPARKAAADKETADAAAKKAADEAALDERIKKTAREVAKTVIDEEIEPAAPAAKGDKK